MCLLNTGEPIYRHLSHHSFFVSDISVCDPSLAPEFDWQTHSDLSESDHYPVILKTSPRDKWTLCWTKKTSYSWLDVLPHSVYVAVVWRVGPVRGPCHHHYLSLNHEGRLGTTDDFATSFLHFSLLSTALWDLSNSRLVHSMILSSYLFLSLSCLLSPLSVPFKMVLARPGERETWPYHCSLFLFTIVRRSSCGSIACWVLARTFSLITWSLYEMCRILR